MSLLGKIRAARAAKRRPKGALLFFSFAVSLAIMVYYWLTMFHDTLAYQVRFVEVNGERKFDWDYFRANFDWLLFSIYSGVTILLSIRVHWKRDLYIIAVGLFCGFLIEAWGTKTSFWFYYTEERPPLWVIPGWAFASLATDRLVQFCDEYLPEVPQKIYYAAYSTLLAVFYFLYLQFVNPLFESPFVWGSSLLIVVASAFPFRLRFSVLTFICGAILGIPIEVWGTTSECWTYYTRETPPLVAIFGHGMACMGFLHLRWLLQRVYFYLAPGKPRPLF